ncbi:MAG: ABC transporter substrate-binding protein, partial [Thermomicrobiales bacterium]
MSNPKTSNYIRDLNRRQLMGSALGAAALSAGAGVFPRLTSAQDDAISGDITYWHHFTSESEMAGLEEATAAFEVAYPEVTVTSENIPNADYMTQFTTAAVAGALPDTAMASVDRIPDMLALDGLIDLTERFNDWDGRDNVPESLMAGATVDDKIVGVPMFLFVDWMYYRKDWFEEAGLTPPETWEEFRETAIALTDTNQGR